MKTILLAISLLISTSCFAKTDACYEAEANEKAYAQSQAILKDYVPNPRFNDTSEISIAKFYVANYETAKVNWEVACEKQKQKAILKAKPGVRIGQSADDVLNKTNWGKPFKINTLTNKYGTTEQWVYRQCAECETQGYLTLKNGKVIAVQTL